MMRPPRNPFHNRIVEKIESDDTFIELFQPSALEVFDGNVMWDRLQILRSSQGGGKTSLLRVFTPPCLRRIWSGREVDKDLGEMYGRLSELDTYGERGPKTLGVMVPCKTPYSTIDHLDIRPDAKLRLFNALVDAKCLAEAIRGALDIVGLPAHNLDRVTLAADDESGHSQLPSGVTGDEAIAWARSIEHKIWSMVDEGDPRVPEGTGHREIYSLQSLAPRRLLVDGELVAERILVMFDDVHKLSSAQRSQLLEHAATTRPATAVWVSERLQAMQSHEVLLAGAMVGREVVEINLADHWMKAAKKDAKVFESIATRRMRVSAVTDQFAAVVRDPEDGPDWAAKLRAAKDILAERLRNRTSGEDLFKNLDINPTADETRLYAEVVRLKAAEIIIERNTTRAQPSLDLPEGLAVPTGPDLADVRAAAEYQASREFKFPYYHGLDVMAKLSSSNVDQFLDVAGNVFEEVLALRVINKRPPVTAARQEQIVLQAARQRWEEIPKRVAGGIKIQRLLKGFAEYALPQSMSKRASYAPGVTGFGITSHDHARLANPAAWRENPELEEVSELLSRCVAHNILYMASNRRQGAKGDEKTLFYLNRLFCALFGLPLGYGGWRNRTPFQIHSWSEIGTDSGKEDLSLDLFWSTPA